MVTHRCDTAVMYIRHTRLPNPAPAEGPAAPACSVATRKHRAQCPSATDLRGTPDNRRRSRPAGSHLRPVDSCFVRSSCEAPGADPEAARRTQQQRHQEQQLEGVRTMRIILDASDNDRVTCDLLAHFGWEVTRTA